MLIVLSFYILFNLIVNIVPVPYYHNPLTKSHYFDPKGRFSLDYPGGWQVNQLTDNDVRFVSRFYGFKTIPYYEFDLFLSNETIAPPTPTSKYFYKLLDDPTNPDPIIKDTPIIYDYRIGNYSWRSFTATYHTYYDNSAGKPKESLWVETTINDTRMSVSVTSDASNLQSIIPLFNQTVTSIYVGRV